MKKIAVMTSGGDAPGMNAGIRAVTRTALSLGLEVVGIYRGYQGMIENDFIPLSHESVRNIIHRGGTFLKTARSDDFRTIEGRAQAAANLKAHGIEGLVVIGGDGSFTGAAALHEEHGVKVVGCPGTIDNDLFGTDYTIGYDTAVNTAVHAIDQIRDTAASHNRLFFVEVMGRDAGFIALRTGLASGAEAVLVPETTTYIEDLTAKLEKNWKMKKSSAIIIVAEGDDAGGAIEIAKKVNAKFEGWESKVTVLGHIQRGGSPTAFDRILASRMGHAAVLALLAGSTDVMIGQKNGEMVEVPFKQAVKHHETLSKHLLDLVEILS
ncbi:MAG: 6-phosphofructokinase [Bacteroidetes bacterium]|nr:MAG: 6-phosphofructokinase [Bacteroidota bacterium]